MALKSTHEDSVTGNEEVQQEPKFRVPLMTALKSGDLKELRWLLSAGADLNSPGRKLLFTRELPELPSYPLLWAIHAEDSEAVQILLDGGADPNMCCEYVCESHTGCLRPLCMAVRTGDADMVDMLLDAGAQVNAQQHTAYQTETALLIAVPAQPDLVEALIERGADVNMTDNSGCGALHHAIIGFNKPLAARLIQVGAAINQPMSVSGLTPLMLALGTKAPPSLVKLLLQCQADTHIQDASGRNALHWAAKELNVWAMKWLIAENVDLNEAMPFRGQPVSAYRYLLETCHHNMTWRCVGWSRCFQRLRAMRVLAEAGAKLVIASPEESHTWTKHLEILNWFVSKSEQLLDSPAGRTCGMTGSIVQEIRSIVDTLIYTSSNPMTLSGCCRVRIRKLLGRDFRTKLQKLNLPAPLQDYLLIHPNWEVVIS